MIFPQFAKIWCIDFEFRVPSGERPTPLCLVARELHSGQLVRQWLEDDPGLPPYGTGRDSLIAAYYASAEMGCHLALGWEMPFCLLDLYAEFRLKTSGLPTVCGNGLLGALAYHGRDSISSSEKAGMRGLAMRGGPYTNQEKASLLDYCQTDVDGLARLVEVMEPGIDLPRALLRGRFMQAAARVEWNGIPIDAEMLGSLRERWDDIKGKLIEEVNRDYGVYVPTGRRPINPYSPTGATILREAKEAGLDPYDLRDAIEHIWSQERAADKDLREAKQKARERTGLTNRIIDKWENEGRDLTLFPNLDLTARDLAGEYPELGIGVGYTSDTGEDDTDYPQRLLDSLRDDPKPKLRTHPEIVSRAIELLTANPQPAPACLSFSSERWLAYLASRGIPWPRLETGQAALDDDTFREMARAYPREVGPIRELRVSLSQLRLQELAVGTDGRNRYLLSAFGSKTGRNQPSASQSIFGPSTWLRSLIKPAKGMAVAYCDWSQQELAIAARLSGDLKMQEAYTSGDFYLTFGKMAGAIPADATKQTHAAQREQFKTVSLGVLYGLSAEGLARKLNVSLGKGRELLLLHRETFRQFWKWSDLVEMQGILAGQLRTVFGWMIHAGPEVNARSLRNFPMQGNGAEMLRLAACLATERGIKVCAPVHDALLVESSIDEIESVVAKTQDAMREASELVLPGFPLRTDAKIVRYPDRYRDPRGEKMWNKVCQMLGETLPILA